MRLEKAKGLHRASLCLAVGYMGHLETTNVVGKFDKTVKVVVNYLKDNGLNFNYNVLSNKMMVKTTVELAEKVVRKDIELESAIQQLEKYLF